MPPRTPDAHDPVLRLGLQLGRAATAWHRATLENIAHLPREGGALLVGNHGVLGFESLAFFHLVHQVTGRFAIGLADRTLFGWQPMRGLLARLGGVPGTRANAQTLLAAGHLVVCYPGGSREVFKDPQARYRLQWERARGFAQLAIEANAPVVPFAAHGVDDAWLNLGVPRWRRRLLGRYAMPTVVGLGLLPLPVPFRFRFGHPLEPPACSGAADRFKAQVQTAVEHLLAAGTVGGRDVQTNAAARIS